MSLPVKFTAGDLAVVDPDSGELLTVRKSSDRALLHAAERLAQHDRDILHAKRAIAAELHQRHGVGKARAGGYRFTATEKTSWPVGATEQALGRLLADGHITRAEHDRCLPAKPKPDARQIKALLGRLLTSNQAAAKVLADACSKSPPSLSDVDAEAVDGSVA